MGKKSRAKKVKKGVLNPSGPKRLDDENLTWESVMDMRKDCVDYLVQQQALLHSLTDRFQSTIKGNQKVNEVLLGTFKSYNDIANKIRENMEFHIQMDENNNIVDYKKGKVDIEDDDYLNYLNIASNYTFAQEQLAALSTTSFTELLTLLNTDGAIDQNDIDKIATTYIENKIELLQETKKTMEDAIGKFNSESNNGTEADGNTTTDSGESTESTTEPSSDTGSESTTKES